MTENIFLTYYKKTRDVVLSKAKDYYKNNKERLREQARNKYRNLPEEAKIKKREYGKNRYHNMSKKENIIICQKCLSIINNDSIVF